ncbi:MAG: hypothetical protein K0Q68_1800 [Moraxellaceae bacterium]|jgi:hypothetical protein|nr:hypothetical protein [Moraxellaceae bacterium]
MRTGFSTAMQALCLGAVLACAPALASNSAADIKTAFIYNFAKFVEWPAAAFASERSPLDLCVAGIALEGHLRVLEGREAQGHPIQVRQLRSHEAPLGCHILVVGALEPAERIQLLQSLARSAVLTIGDGSDFTRDGGMIALFVAANRVQFSVNLVPAQGAGLKLSSRMLQLAHSVRGGTP